MRYLLDTNVFLWSLGAEHKLNKQAAKLLSSNLSQLYLSAASSWEIAIKFALGSLTLPKAPAEFIPLAMGLLAIRPLDITHHHSLAAGELPPHHRDPFDRMLIAQSLAEGMVLLTGDRSFTAYEVEIIFCGR